jgi:hypothetical protein
MSNKFNTALSLGTKSPFILIMQLNKAERALFIEKVDPGLLPSQKHCTLKMA